MSSAEASTSTTIEPATKKLPPIFVETNPLLPWHTLAKEMYKNPGLDKVVTKTTSKPGQITINCPDEKSFRTIQTFLDGKKDALGYHSFSIPQDRPVKVAIKGIPLDVSEEELKNELTARGFEPTIIRAFAKDGRRLPIHMVVLTRDSNTKQIFEITDLFYVQIKVESYRQSGLPQCFNCQRFGHSSLRCGYNPRCVKCGKDHATRDCTKTKELPGRCCNCGADHTANYRGCTSYTTAMTEAVPKQYGPRQTPAQRQQTIITPPNTIQKSYANTTRIGLISSQPKSESIEILTIIKDLLISVIDSPDNPTKSAVLQTIMKILEKSTTNLNE